MYSSNFYLITGLASLTYTLFAIANYYTLTGVNLISSPDAKQMIKKGKFDYIIDVRTKLERTNLGYYPGSIHIPVTQFSMNKFSKIPKDSSVLIYCNTGQRARRAAELMTQYGYSKVYYIAGFYKSLM